MVKYAWYPGCVSQGGCPELYTSMAKVCSVLGIELEELKGAACTGAGVLTERNPELADTLNARTFAMAEQVGAPLLTNCSTCQGVMSQANAKLQADAKYRARVNGHLAAEGLEYKGTAVVKHLLWALVEDYGLDNFKAKVVRPLAGLKAAPFYGCYILRPTKALGIDETPARRRYLELLIAACGAEPVDYDGKFKCCGFPILTMNEKNSVNMVGTHTLDAKGHGAHCMVTPCPLCHLNLDGYQIKAAGMKGQQINIPILHLPQLLGLALGLSAKELRLNHHIISTQAVTALAKA
ncbi:MAG: CoB--CoM heterodisulfide reductase iron-sulfur subunit B family protein [Chloroflexi bacterium]|nr:CoB--CoM heterodisulfide reductase iron-sulfur subunit B family protein [Chloroflexota bacterium]